LFDIKGFSKKSKILFGESVKSRYFRIEI